MAKTRSMTRTHNHDDDGASSSAKRPKTCAPWSDLDHNLLFLVMIQLGVVDFLSFRGVCKSWRSLACENQNKFMASSPPMSTSIISTDTNEKACYLEDFEGRKFKTILPHFLGGKCIGLTCGYLVFFMRETHEFRLVNPITRHQLHFPDIPYIPVGYHPERAIIVFSASISKWVFVVLVKYDYVIWFSIAGERAWNHVSYRHRICDLHAFKGKIYTLSSFFHLSELRLGGPQPEFTPLEIKQPDCASPNELVSSSENFYGIRWYQDYPNRLYELDLGEMKWVKVKACEKRMEEYAFFSSELNEVVVAVKRESWADPRSRSHGRYAYIHNNGKIRFITAKMWYFPHECLNVDHRRMNCTTLV